jgi:sirohydrochlorin ferrochelatase
VALEFTFEAYGDELIRRKLLDIGGRAIDARPAFSAIADDLMAFERKRFDTQGEGTWAPDLPATVLEKRRKQLDPRVLHATLALRRSLTERDPAQELTVTPSFLIFGSKVKYAKYLQRGTRKMVARKPLGFQETQKRAVLKRLQRFVMTGDPGSSAAGPLGGVAR